jgi:hypothetical protein
VDQLSAQVFVATLADPEQLWLAAGGELPRNEAKPCSKIAPTVEAFRLALATKISPEGGEVAGRLK